jgi:hypothetical protein
MMKNKKQALGSERITKSGATCKNNQTLRKRSHNSNNSGDVRVPNVEKFEKWKHLLGGARHP